MSDDEPQQLSVQPQPTRQQEILNELKEALISFHRSRWKLLDLKTPLPAGIKDEVDHLMYRLNALNLILKDTWKLNS